MSIGSNEMFVSSMESGSGQPQIFETIQGEGRHTGEPATFVRLSGCNLSCSWCDVPETWAFTPELGAVHERGQSFDPSQERLEINIDMLASQVLGSRPERLVVTGGEPLMQQDKVLELIGRVKSVNPDFQVEIETNGTIAPSIGLVSQVDQFNISPKLENSGNLQKKRDKPTAMETFVGIPHADFKFVISREADVEEALGIVDKYKIPPSRVFLMPEGRTQEEIEMGQRELVEYCLDNGFNLSSRLHIFLFGDKRGT